MVAYACVLNSLREGLVVGGARLCHGWRVVFWKKCGGAFFLFFFDDFRLASQKRGLEISNRHF